MKKYIMVLLASSMLVLSGCEEKKSDNVLKFATCADYPPFEYWQNGELKGFDVELGTLIAQELGKKAVFEDMQFSSILASLDTERVEAGISTIAVTEERQKSFDFSIPYHFDALAAVFKGDSPVTEAAQLADKKIIACQLGSTMEIWAKQNLPTTSIITVDNNNQAVEMLKAGRVDAVLVDGLQGAAFSKQDDSLSYAVIAQSKDGYSIAFKKGTALKKQVDEAIQALEAKGEVAKLKSKWLEDK